MFSSITFHIPNYSPEVDDLPLLGDSNIWIFFIPKLTNRIKKDIPNTNPAIFSYYW